MSSRLLKKAKAFVISHFKQNHKPSPSITVALIIFLTIISVWLLSTLFTLARIEITVLYNSTKKLVESSTLLIADLKSPQKFVPVARFTSNMDWETNTISLDGSTSKTFDGNVSRYVWRIDDGSSDSNAEKFTHTFNHPGYYLIRLSVIDSIEQVDSATCQIYVPPEEIEAIQSQQKQNTDSDQNQLTNTSIEWAPVGTFYNYTKMRNVSNAALKSRYVESGCGLSNRNFNAIRKTIDRTKVASIISSLVALVVNILFVVGGIILVRIFIRKISRSIKDPNPSNLD